MRSVSDVWVWLGNCAWPRRLLCRIVQKFEWLGCRRAKARRTSLAAHAGFSPTREGGRGGCFRHFCSGRGGGEYSIVGFGSDVFVCRGGGDYGFECGTLLAGEGVLEVLVLFGGEGGG